MPARRPHVLPVIVVSQFGGTSLWFAGNAVAADLAAGLDPAHAASAVQLGFIAGTLLSARLRLSDRWPAPALFCICCLLGALLNFPATAAARGAGDYAVALLLALRFAVGVALAGIYPVGIKVAAGWYREGLGRALGYLTAALVLGTAFPYLVRGLGATISWQTVLGASSLAAALSGLLLWLTVPEGPHVTGGASSAPAAGAWATIRRIPRLRAAAAGYFGHMWELYAFWAFVPLFLASHVAPSPAPAMEISRWSFAVIAAGAIGCAGGGIVATRFGSAPVALAQLSVSGLCCLLSPLAYSLPTPLFAGFLLVWGIAVVGDSPQFSALNALEAPRAQVGSIVTLINSIGFAITIASIQLLALLAAQIDARWMMLVLAAGPLAGGLAFRRVYFPRAART